MNYWRKYRTLLQRYGLLISCCLGGITIAAQTQLSSTDLLSMAVDSMPNTYEKVLSFLQNEPQNVPFVGKLAFRTETDEFDWKRQEYLVRAGLNGTKVQKAHRKSIAMTVQVFEKKQAAFFQKKLKETYQFILDGYFLEERERLLNRQKVILDDKKKVYEKRLLNNQIFSLDDFLKNETSLQEIQRDSAKILTERAWLRRNFTAQQPIQIQYKNWIRLPKMRAVVTAIKGQVAQNPKYRTEAAEVALTKTALTLEEAKGKKVLDFVQVKYRGDDKLNFGREWSLGLGLNIPTKFSSRTKRHKALLEVLEEEQALELLEASLVDKLESYHFLFNAYVQEYELLTKQIKKDQNLQKLKPHLQHPSVDVMTLFKIKENQLKNEKTVLEIEQNLYELYLTILEVSGKLGQPPFVNYLSETLDVLVD